MCRIASSSLRISTCLGSWLKETQFAD
ncbi:hypothetical protein LINGRAHAP2_LOCUS7622 [Linum grandiflorum]